MDLYTTQKAANLIGVGDQMIHVAYVAYGSMCAKFTLVAFSLSPGGSPYVGP